MSILDFGRSLFRDALGNKLPRRTKVRYQNFTVADDPDNEETVLTAPVGDGIPVTTVAISVAADGTLGLDALAAAGLDAAASVTLTSSADRTIHGLAFNPDPTQVFPGKTFVNGNPDGGGVFLFPSNSTGATGSSSNRWQILSAEGPTYRLMPGQSLRVDHYEGSTNRWVKQPDNDALTTGETAATLATRVGRKDREVRKTTGRGEFQYDASSVATPISGFILGTGTGRWVSRSGKVENLSDIVEKQGGVLGTANDTSAIMAAINAFKAANGHGTIRIDGKWFAKIQLTSASHDELTLEGFGKNTGFKGVAGNSYVLSVNEGSGGTSDPADNAKKIAIRNMALEQYIDTLGTYVDGTHQHWHALNINACSDSMFENLFLYKTIGDGVYVGSGNTGGIERHNENLVFSNIEVDGYNKGGRNGISIIDLVNGDFRNARIFRVAKSTMPGGIDIEPDHTFNRVQNITFYRPFLRDVGGNAGAICMIVQNNDLFTLPVQNISIYQPDIRGCAHGIVLSGYQANKPHMIRVWGGSVVEGSGVPLGIYGVRDVVVHGTTFSEWDQAANIGYDDAGSPTNAEATRAKDVTIRDSKIHRCGRTSAIGLQLFRHTNVDLDNVTLEDCGASDLSGGDAIKLQSVGGAVTSSGLRAKIRVIPGTRTINTAINKHALHTSDAKSNIASECDFGGLPSILPASRTRAQVQVGSFLSSDLPDSFTNGIHDTLVNTAVTADAGFPFSSGRGMMRVTKLTSDTGYRKFTIMEAWPANDTPGTRSIRAWRYAQSGSNAWETAWNFDGAMASVTSTVDLPSLSPGESYESGGISCPGAALGDFAEVSCSVYLQGLKLEAEVTAADVVRFKVANLGGVRWLPSITVSSLDLPSIADNSQYQSIDYAYTGAALGDFVEASCSRVLSGLKIEAEVSAADLVRFKVTNNSGGAVDLASANFKIQVRKEVSGSVDLGSATFRIRVRKDGA